MEFDALYEESIAIVKAIPADEVRSLDMPEEDAIVEANRVFIAAQEDWAGLSALGCPTALLTAFPKRIELFRYLANYFLLRLDETVGAKADWIAKKVQGYVLRRKLFLGFDVAYRKSPARMKQVGAIKVGKGDSDMVFDLLSCYEMGTAYPDELTAVNFPKATLEQAKNLHLQLSTLIAKSTIAPDEEKQFRELRNRAYTWLRQAMDEMRVFGVWLHADNEEKASNYISKYNSDLGKLSGASRRETEESLVISTASNMVD